MRKFSKTPNWSSLAPASPTAYNPETIRRFGEKLIEADRAYIHQLMLNNGLKVDDEIPSRLMAEIRVQLACHPERTAYYAIYGEHTALYSYNNNSAGEK